MVKKRSGGVFDVGWYPSAHYKYFLGNSVFRLVAVLKSINKVFKKQLWRNPFLSEVAPNLSTKSLINTCSKICIFESCCVYMNKPQCALWILFRQSSFYIGSYFEIYQQGFQKITSKKCICKLGSSEFINKIVEKYLGRNLHFRKLLCIYEQNLWNTPVKKFFYSVYHSPCYVCDCLNVPLLESLTSASVNHFLETPCLFTWHIMKT